MDKLSELLKSVRPATKEELREQGENLAKNYKPGPRQAVPFLPTMEARVEQESKLLEHPEFMNRLMDRVTALEAENAALRADGTKAAEELAKLRGNTFEAVTLTTEIGVDWTIEQDGKVMHGPKCNCGCRLEKEIAQLQSELARKRERHQELRQVVKEYRQKHRIRYGCDMEVAADKPKCDDRCSICKQADAILEPKAEPAPAAAETEGE